MILGHLAVTSWARVDIALAQCISAIGMVTEDLHFATKAFSNTCAARKATPDHADRFNLVSILP